MILDEASEKIPLTHMVLAHFLLTIVLNYATNTSTSTTTLAGSHTRTGFLFQLRQ